MLAYYPGGLLGGEYAHFVTQGVEGKICSLTTPGDCRTKYAHFVTWGIVKENNILVYYPGGLSGENTLTL